ncbi:MAG: proline--tRNA ligase [Deltaproteobacteria bacterium]|nr:MAG: proline--tRNA ligase [Deltaproteobacteria bacterium]
MRLSSLFAPTLKEAPSDAVFPSHILLVRAGYIRQLAAGIYSFLPLGWRVMRKIEAIIREEMEAVGAQEFLLPALHPREVWDASGRWEVMGENLFRLQDRGGRDLCLGMTHEEIFTRIAASELRSYRDLPQVWYQIQTKFRDEPRPKGGLLRVREFIMKDAYSFDLDEAGLDAAFEAQREAYVRIFDRCGLKFHAVQAHSGAMGGNESVEFMVRTPAGEDQVAACEACGYAANTEKATSRPEPVSDPDSVPEPEKFPTPGLATIEELAAAFPDLAPPERQIKTLVYIAGGDPVLVLLRGDDELMEAKLEAATGCAELRPATAEEIQGLLGAEPGSLGAVGVTEIPVYADRRLEGRRGMVTGANETGFHLKNVDVDRDLCVRVWADLRTVRAGEPCPECGAPLEVFEALEVGHIFKLGTKYSEAMGAYVLDETGRQVPIVMGSYGIGVGRIMAAAVELCHDEDGIVWPMSIAPFQVEVVPLQMQDAEVRQAAEAIYEALSEAGIEVLLDDRDERAGVKFKDADLYGLPVRIAIGGRGLKEGVVELKLRRETAVKKIDRDPAAVVAAVRALLEA